MPDELADYEMHNKSFTKNGLNCPKNQVGIKVFF